MSFHIQRHPSTPYSHGYADHRDIMAYINDLRAQHGDEPVTKLPRDFSCSLWVPLKDGREIVMYVREGRPMRMGSFGRLIKSSQHRCHVHCPDCDTRVPVGRTHQHKCRGVA